MPFYATSALILLSLLVTVDMVPNTLSRIRVKVNKCCEKDEIFVGPHCQKASEVNSRVWEPIFSTSSQSNIQIEYELVHGLPDCGSVQPWDIYHYPNSTDVLQLRPDGTLRHYLHHIVPGEEVDPGIENAGGKNEMFYDYTQGLYCMDKNIKNNLESEYALVCPPKYEHHWTNTVFIMRNIVNPLTHGIAMICYMTIAIVYFVMPTLKDLVGNIVTTICMCLIISQAADMTRILTVYLNHVSLIAAEAVCYFGLLGAFFWLNSLGYYIWKTFKSRNVFLRITDGKKYCYYSSYAWVCTILMGAMALFAHYTMDYPQAKPQIKNDEQDRIGSLAMIIFFVPIAFTVLVNIFFFTSTLKVINRMNTYGRIHHKLKHSFRMFLLLFLVMSLNWVFFLMSFSNYDGLIYAYIIVNSFQGPAILYICLFDQKHVSYLIKKTCCYVNCICPCCRPEPEAEWGDEMQAMNTGIY